MYLTMDAYRKVEHHGRMAYIVHIAYRLYDVDVPDLGDAESKKTVEFTPRTTGKTRPANLIEQMPVLYWADRTLWTEANVWLAFRATLIRSGELAMATVYGDSWSLLTYANWLEETNSSWSEFGFRRSSRPTVRFRGYLIDRRDSGDRMSSKTASQRMGVVIAFYRWLLESRLFDPEYPPFRQSPFKVTAEDKFGLGRTITGISADLSIPAGHTRVIRLEGGLQPVDDNTRSQILELAKNYCSAEFSLMLQIGFFTGMRLQSILDLKIRTIEDFISSRSEKYCYLRIGPKFGVSTKNSVDGQVLMPNDLRVRLREYAYSVRRLRREAKAIEGDKGLLFLTKSGRRYANRGLDRSPTVNVDMGRLRTVARAHGLNLNGFYFHCTRATFGTSIVSAGMVTKSVSLKLIIGTLRDLLFHADERTSLLYIKYFESQKVRIKYEEQYSAWLFGTL